MKYLIPILFLCPLIGEAQNVISAKPAAEIPRSTHYQLTVNDTDIFVYQAPTAAYGMFDMGSPVTVRIKANRDVKWVDIRPKSLRIKPTWGNDSTITFKLDKPAKLSIELNGQLTMPLYIFAGAPEKDKPSRNDKNVIFFEAGKVHAIGLLTIHSDQTVYIEAGAVVRGAIRAANAQHIRVTGRGILDGAGNNRKDNPNRPSHFLSFVDCTDVEVEGVTLHNGTTWQVVPVHCNEVRIRNINIISDNPSDDGIDVARSRNVTIENCFIRTKDDCIAIKANFDYPPEEIVENVRVENCVFWNALWGNALEIGFELRAKEVKNISFVNCDIIHVEAGAAISIHNADQSVVHHVLFDNIRIEDARHKLFDVAILLSRYSVDGPKDEAEVKRRYLVGAWDGVMQVPAEKLAYHAAYRGWIKDVTFRNIYVEGIFPFSIFYGFNEAHPVENITIENLVVNGTPIKTTENSRIYQHHTVNLTLH
ncbi:MAG: glycosyl hydrolase family 28 protein [Steroidobacter sp.]